MDLLTLSGMTTHCPFKDNTVYFLLSGSKDIAWSYEQPIEGMEARRVRWRFISKLANDAFRPKADVAASAESALLLHKKPNLNYQQLKVYFYRLHLPDKRAGAFIQ